MPAKLDLKHSVMDCSKYSHRNIVPHMNTLGMRVLTKSLNEKYRSAKLKDFH